MAVASAWATGHAAVPRPQLRPTSASSTEPLNQIFKKFSLNLPYKFLIRRSKGSGLSCSCTDNFDNDRNYSDWGNNSVSSSSTCQSSSSSADWDWNRWTRHFSEIEQAENYVSVLKFQLEDAVEKEDFQEAAKLKVAIDEATSKDRIAEIMSQLKVAIDEERYNDASRLCQITGSGLVGWWGGCGKDSDNPFGGIIRITPAMGRLVAKWYTPRQLVAASPGTPLFEIFVVKDPNEKYNMQVVFLKQVKPNSNSSSDKSTKGPSAAETENASVVNVKLEESETKKGEVKSNDLEGADKETIINFLKEKIPELRIRVDLTQNITEDTLKQEDSENMSGNDTDDKATVDNNQPDRVSVEGDSDTTGDEKNLDRKLFIDGVLHNNEDVPMKEEFVRIPAEIENKKDSFILHIPKRYHDKDPLIASKAKEVAETEKGVSELMPPDVAKLSGNLPERIKLANNLAHKQDWLSEYTYFSRINTSKGDSDPFEGLYVGAFPPYGTEVVQLRRKYGNWNVNNDEKSSDLEFYEYVEAVKLTGNFDVPAGQVIFRAKIGKGSRLDNWRMYPHELGVVASYKGQRRIADFGFENPKWVDGELLQFNGKSLEPYLKGAGAGADLGFLHVVPEYSYVVLFRRLKKLPE